MLEIVSPSPMVRRLSGPAPLHGARTPGRAGRGIGAAALSDSDDKPASIARPAQASAAVPARPIELDGGHARSRTRHPRKSPRPIIASNISQFLEGARGAYQIVLEAFWNADRETLRELCDDDVYQGFVAAIDAREAAGETV